MTLALATKVDHPIHGQVVVGIKTADVDAAAKAVEASGGGSLPLPTTTPTSAAPWSTTTRATGWSSTVRWRAETAQRPSSIGTSTARANRRISSSVRVGGGPSG